MARPNDPRISRPPLLPTPINIYPELNGGNFHFSRRPRYQISNIYPNYNNNFWTESINPNAEIYSESTNPTPEICSELIDNYSNVSPEPIDPKLDICSESFDASFLLNQPYGIVKNVLPYPKAKEYNNLAEYYSHVFLKKDNFKKAEKDKLYDRDYTWYYKILGWDHRIQQRYEQRILRRTRKYAGWLTAKLRKYRPRFRNDDPNYEPCRGFPPLQSTKIIQPQSKLRKYKVFPRNLVTDRKESNDENLMSDIPELNMAKENALISKPESDSATVTKVDLALSSKNVLMSETVNNST